ncbi:MAG: AAA family ATPase [Clostridia bacterium]|nr:AAA family ATPase [Clostridia bacterium]
MGKIIIVASLKGGVGKTTLTAALSSRLADMGKKVLAVDMDFGIRSLDIALGFENSALPDCYDVIMGRSSLSVACEKSATRPNLYFLAAPMRVNPNSEAFELPQKLLNAFLNDARRDFDYVFLDMSAGNGRVLTQTVSSGLVSTALAVCTHNAASIRATEKLASSLYADGIEDIKLVINSFLVWRAEKDEESGVVDIINRSSTPLIGVVPFEEQVEEMLSHGIAIVDDKKSLAGRAASNIAHRLIGENVPLFDGVFPKNNRLKLY